MGASIKMFQDSRECSCAILAPGPEPLEPGQKDPHGYEQEDASAIVGVAPSDQGFMLAVQLRLEDLLNLCIGSGFLFQRIHRGLVDRCNPPGMNVHGEQPDGGE